MRYEDRNFCEAEVSLREHNGLRVALGLERTSDYTVLYRFLRWVPERTDGQALAEAVHRLPPPSGGTTVTVDGTGLAPGPSALSMIFLPLSGE